MDYFLFSVTSFLAFVYFFYSRRYIDVYLVAAVSGILFFSVAFLGEVEGPPNYPPLTVSSTLHYSFSLYFIAILLCAWIKDKRCQKHHDQTKQELITNHRAAMLAIAVWCAASVYLMASYPALLFAGTKTEFMLEAGFQHTLTLSLSTLAATCVLTSKLSWRFTVASVIIGFSVLAGSRTTAALSIVACVLVYGQRVGPIALFRARPVLYPIALVVLVASGASLKYVYSSFRADGVAGVKGMFASKSIAEVVVGGAEFLSTQYIFADVVECDYRTDGKHIFWGWLSVLPIPRSWYGAGSGEFNELFQGELYSDVHFGMAYNPFAEFYAGAGIVGIIVFVGGMLVGLYTLDNCIGNPRCAAWVPVMAIAGSLLAFYIHRNSVGVTFAMIRNVLWPYAVMLFLCSLWRDWVASGDGPHALWRQEGSIMKRRLARKPAVFLDVESAERRDPPDMLLENQRTSRIC